MLGSCAIACGDPSGMTTDAAGTTTDAAGTTTDAMSATSPTGNDTNEPPSATCTPGSGSGTVREPTLLVTLKDRWEEAWLGSAAVADLDGDGVQEIVVPRGETVW